MKGIIHILALVLFTLQVSFAGKVSHVYYFNDPVIERSGKYSLVYFAGTRLLGEEGKATLPFCAVQLLLPPGEVATSVSITYDNEMGLDGTYRLMPRQAVRPVSMGNSGTWLEDARFYQSDKFYPSDFDAAVRTHFMNGCGIAVSAFCPLRYKPADGEVSYFEKVTVTIETGPDPDAGERSRFRHQDVKKDKAIQAIVDNPDMLAFYQSPRELRTGEYDYLVVTKAQFLTEFDTLKHFYLQRGYRTQVATIEHIDSTVSGIDQQQRIRNYIIGEYQDHDIGYVLLGGDAEIVPYRGFYCNVLSGGSNYTDYGIPSDLYYSALDGTWDDDLDGIWGETDEDDLYPEVAVGRLTFSDTVELHNMLHKSFLYQSSPVQGELTHPLLAGEHLWSNPLTYGADYLRLLIGYHTNNGYTTQGIPTDQSIDSLFDENAYWDKYTLMAEINSGKPWLHHCGHSNYTYAMRMYNDDVTNSNFSGANGIDHNYTIVYTHGCMCGGFDASDCIAERMVGIDNFAVAFVGNSRYGWFNEGTTDGPSEHLHREFLDAIYRDSLYHAGDAMMRSKAQTAPFVDLSGEWEPGATRWCFYDNYLLGDPMMALWTEEPHAIFADYRRLIPAGADSLVVILSGPGGPYEGFTCALLKNDTLYGTAYSDVTGRAVIQISDNVSMGNAQLAVNGYNILAHTFPLDISDYWLGNSNDWNDPDNWYSHQVPGPGSCIIIPEDPAGPYFPERNTGPARTCKAILVEPGVHLLIRNGETFSVQGNQ